MLFSVMAGRGGMAQFSHPEFGGSGQWMAGGAIMISDMFNNALKARVDALCNELSALVRREPDFVAADSLQSQSQGARWAPRRESSSLLVPEKLNQANWWPADLGVPSSLGAQNEVRYAYFPATRRLAIDINGKVIVYDTRDHQISGFSQQQPGSGSLSFSSQLGGVDVSRLPVVCGAKGTASPQPTPITAPEQPATASNARREDILTAIERLAELHARGILTEAEFSAKKAELLDRLLTKSRNGIRHVPAKEVVRADEENDSASQSLVQRRGEGTQSAFESSNASHEDCQSDEANGRRAETESWNSRYWPGPRSLGFRRSRRPRPHQTAFRSATASTLWATRTHSLSRPACARGIPYSSQASVGLPARRGRETLGERR